MLTTAVDKFRGVSVELNDIRGDPRTILVRFAIRQAGDVRGLGDERGRDRRQALVIVRVAREPEIVGYIPAEHEFPSLGQGDFERRALEEVRAHLVAATRA